MAHYAHVDDGGVVQQVIVVANEVEGEGTPQEQEVRGQAWLAAFPPTAGKRMLKTSYNGTFRKNYAAIGATYDQARDAFIPPKPSKNYYLDEETCRWLPIGGDIYAALV